MEVKARRSELQRQEELKRSIYNLKEDENILGRQSLCNFWQ